MAWDVRRLIAMSQGLAIERVPLSNIVEVDENYWYALEGQMPTCRSILGHVALIEQADLSFPVILDADGRVMDGMHRICKAMRKGDTHIEAVRFQSTPHPDYVGRQPQDLQYD